jgi:hypothetical protein
MVNHAQIVMLVPASVGSQWFWDHIYNEEGVTVWFLKGRPSFDGKGAYPKDCMIVVFDGKSRDCGMEVWDWRNE